MQRTAHLDIGRCCFLPVFELPERIGHCFATQEKRVNMVQLTASPSTGILRAVGVATPA
jgi:hypothetical protein